MRKIRNQKSAQKHQEGTVGQVVDKPRQTPVPAPSDDRVVANRLITERKLDRLYREVDEVRKCLHKPNLEGELYLGTTGRPLELRGRDWALVPTDWVSVTTPDIECGALWSDKFEMLLEILKRCSFIEHFDRLKDMATKLEKDLSDAVEGYERSRPDLKRMWKHMQDVRSCIPETTRMPSFPQPDWNKVRPPYEDSLARMVCGLLVTGEIPDNKKQSAQKPMLVKAEATGKGPMPDLYQRLWELVSMLDQMNKDLSPTKVDKVLAEVVG